MPSKDSSMNNLTFRKPTSADIAALVDLENQCFVGRRYDAVRLTEDDYQYYVEESADDLVVVIDATGRIIGCLVMIFSIDLIYADIESIAIAIDARHCGIGHALMIEAENKVREKGCIAIRLEVHEENHQAISLYRSMGYVPCGTMPDTYSDGGAILAFSKEIGREQIQSRHQ